MTNHATINVMQASGWRLLNEFARASLYGNDGQLIVQVKSALQELGVHGLQLERIREAFAMAVGRATRAGEQGLLYPIRVRIWVIGSCAYDCGWGYFLVEKRNYESRGAGLTAEAEKLVELFLYQEQES